ncbi:hypothetical protein ACFLTN_05650 [Chloroflexota bacterium]
MSLLHLKVCVKGSDTIRQKFVYGLMRSLLRIVARRLRDLQDKLAGNRNLPMGK